MEVNSVSKHTHFDTNTHSTEIQSQATDSGLPSQPECHACFIAFPFLCFLFGVHTTPLNTVTGLHVTDTCVKYLQLVSLQTDTRILVREVLSKKKLCINV